MGAALCAEHGFEGSIAVIPNARRAGIHAVVGKQKRALIFTAGRLWDSAKNVAALCEAAPSLDWPIYVAGDECDLSGRRLDLPNVHCLGQLDEASMDQWLSRAAIYALPARYEPFGLSVLEAAMARCALVLGDIPSLRENWDGAAVFVPPDAVDCLAAELQRLIADGQLRQHLAAAAHQRASRFSTDEMAAAYLQCYAAARSRVTV